MKRHLLRISFSLALLAVLLTATWWGWREYYAAGALQEAVKENDAERVYLLLKLGAPVGEDIDYTDTTGTTTNNYYEIIHQINRLMFIVIRNLFFRTEYLLY